MKIKLLTSTALACAVATALAVAAPLTETTAVHTKPEASSPAITYLKAGTEPTAASDALANTPAGWMAVEIPGPFSGYVEKKDMTKGLNVKPGVAIHLKPETSSGVLAVAERGDKTTITGLHGRWAQISLQKNLVGYINIGSAPSAAPLPSGPASSGTAAVVTQAPVTDASAYAPPPPSNLPGQPVTDPALGDSSSTLPRQLTGKFVSTRSLLHPRRPYDWELDDNSGRRFAYLDTSKLLLTEQIEKYAGHFVVVFGAAKATADGKDIVIQVESLQLLMR